MRWQIGIPGLLWGTSAQTPHLGQLWQKLEELCTSPVKKSLDQLGNRRGTAAERRKCWAEEPMFLMGQDECIAVCYVVSPKLQWRLSKKRFYWLQTLRTSSSFPSSLFIPIYGLSGYSFVCSRGRAVSASRSKVARRPLLKGCMVPAQTSKTKGEREF